MALKKIKVLLMGLLAVFLLTVACSNDDENGEKGPVDLTGTVMISPSANVFTGMELTADYSGTENVSYQWNRNTVAVSGAVGTMFTPTEAGNYTVTVSAAGFNSKTSAIVAVAPAPVITIAVQPTVTTNATVGNISGNLTVAAGVTENATLTYQWFSNVAGANVGGTAIAGATSASFAIPATLTAGTYYYYVVISAIGAVPVASNVATITVTEAIPDTPVISITAQPVATTNATAGSISGNLTVAASVTESATLTYQWFSNTTASNTGGTAIAGATSTSFAIPTTLTTGTYHYYVVISATGGAMAVSSTVATVVVAAPTPVITITAQPAATTNATAGSISGNLTVAASVTESATLTYQWFSNTTASNTGGTAIAGATGASFAIPTTLAAGTYHYYVVVSATGATAVSSTVATVVVGVPLVAATVERFLAEPTQSVGASQIATSFLYRGYSFYYIHLGVMRNIPTFLVPSVQFNAMSDLGHRFSHSVTTETELRTIVSTAQERVRTEVRENTTSRGSTFTLGQQLGAKSIIPKTPITIDLKLSAQQTWSQNSSNFVGTTTHEMFSRTETVEHFNARRETLTQSIDYTFSAERGYRAGHYRWGLFAISDVYLVVAVAPNGNMEYEIKEYVRDGESWLLDFCENGRFERNSETNFEFDASILDDLPTPEVTLTPRYTLTVNAGSGGTVSRNPNQTTYETGTQVTVTATPNSGYAFNGWTGAPAGVNASNPSITFPVNSDLNLTANFRLMTRRTETITLTNPGSQPNRNITGPATVEVYILGGGGGGQGGSSSTGRSDSGGGGGSGGGIYMRFNTTGSVAISNINVGGGGARGGGRHQANPFGSHNTGYPGESGSPSQITMGGVSFVANGGMGGANVVGGSGGTTAPANQPNISGISFEAFERHTGNPGRAGVTRADAGNNGAPAITIGGHSSGAGGRGGYCDFWIGNINSVAGSAGRIIILVHRYE